MSVDRIAESPPGTAPASPPPVRRVVALRHPWRWAASIVIALVVLWGVEVLVSTEAFGWDVVGRYLFSPAVLEGIVGTLYMTVLAVALGVVVGTLVAIMRLSPNPILSAVAAFYQWFFRGTPTLVQLIFWFNLSSVFPNLELALFGQVLVSVPANDVMTPFVAALLGLGLNFGAYHSEIMRAGIISVDEGQTDAATAYGLTRFQTYRSVVLPQAMRVIIPPLGNEIIGMLKWTSLASVVSYSELLHTVGVIYNRNFQVIPLLIVAAIWYLFMTSVLSVCQVFIEKRFARGTRRNPPPSAVRTALTNSLRRVRA
jgi:polar amino acid transport system permease protein